MSTALLRPVTVEAETIGARDVQPDLAPPPARPATGDDFADAVAEHHDSLARLAYALCGNVAQAEDAVAEAYAKVWPRWRRGRVDNLFGYLRRTVVNEVYGKHRRRKLERREAERPPERLPDGQFEAQVDNRDILWDGLARLSPLLRVVVVLRIVEDLSEEQTALMLDIPTGTVKSRLSRGLAILRATIGNDHE
jgi:RNA polymerase sigma-70 factor (sigma-E family)